MNCPIDGTELHMTERQGIEIDYCPKCRGIWLDRGELDKLIERSLQVERGSYQPVSDESAFRSGQEGQPYTEKRKRQGDNDDDDDRYDDDYRKRRRGGFLEDLFDIFD